MTWGLYGLAQIQNIAGTAKGRLQHSEVMGTLRVVTSQTAAEPVYVSAKELAVRWNMGVDAARNRGSRAFSGAGPGRPHGRAADQVAALTEANAVMAAKMERIDRWDASLATV